MADSLQVLVIAGPDDAVAWLVSVLREGGIASDCRRVADGPACRAALSAERFDLVACLVPDTARLGDVEALRDFRPDDDPPLVIVTDALDDCTGEAHRLGAVVCLRRAGLAHLAPAVEQARARNRRRDERLRLDAFEQGQRAVLERIAAGAPLPALLEQIVRLVEAQAAGMVCSILLLDGERGRLRHGAAPGLPEEFQRAIDDAEIGPQAGSCGAAAFRREAVVVEDIGTHPSWAAYRHLALPHGLRACWSSPIFSSEGGDVLGTFAMYYREARGPEPRERPWVERATALAAVAIARDRAERAVRESEARYRQMVDTAYEGVWLLDAAACTVLVNARTAEMLGFAPSEMLGRSLLDFMDEPSRRRAEGGFLERLRTVQEQQEFRFRRRDGTAFPALVAGSPLSDPQGRVTGALCMLTDIGELKAAEEALRLREAESRVAFESAPIGMAIAGPDGRLLRANPALERFLARTEAALRGSQLGDHLHPDERASVLERRAAFARGERDTCQDETRYMRPDGGVQWGRTIAAWVRDTEGRPLLELTMVENVTERREMEEAVSASERLRTLMYGAINDVVFYLGVEDGERFRFLSVNGAFLRATGLKEGEVVGRPVEEVIPEPARAQVIASYRRAIEERRTVTWDEVSVYPAGTKYGEVTITPAFDPDGSCTNLIGTVHDVTGRRRAEELLRAQATILDRARDAILVRGLDGRIEYWNKGAERLYGYPASEAVGRDARALLYPDTTAFDRAQACLVERGAWSGELAQRTRAGGSVTVEGSWTLLRDEQGEPRSVLAINTDITERKRLEAQVLRAQRLESLGTLAGGIAHDFNNILTAIVGNVALARDSLPTGHEAQARLDDVEKAGARASDLVRQILTFGRRQESRREVVAVEPLVREALRLLRATTPAMIEIESRFAPDLPEVLADPTQLHQVVMNLGTNAVHAIGPGPGRLELVAERVTLERGLSVAGSELAPGEYVRVVVSDTGAGMEEAVLEQIFEPFFTTKAAGQGTGLGLSVVHGIVKGHEGAIAVRSTPGRGTEFSLYFPAAPARAPARRASPAPAVRGNGEHVLCVDDEPAVVQVLARLLERLGYRVSTDTDPLRALEVLATEGGIDAVVSDFSMPGLSGLDFARRALAARPGLPVVMMSGRLPSEDAQAAREAGVREIVAKPGIDEIGPALRRALDAARGAPGGG